MNGATMTSNMENQAVWRSGPVALGMYVLTAVVLTWSLYDHGLNRMFDNWMTREEYSHCLMIPFISLFLIWQKKNDLEQQPYEGAWQGIFITLFGILSVVLGQLSAITIFIQYGYYIVLTGMAAALLGWKAFKTVWVAFLLLFFTIPLPGLIYQGISQQLQLVSTYLGVLVIRAFGISVFVEGNVIDLGIYKLQVVDACAGLRYLFPLMTLGLIMAYFFKVETWKRVVLFLSSIPITVLMNSFRIGVIGILVEYYGTEMAEGFLHDFEGWIVFMACMGIMLLITWLMVYFSKDQRPFQEVFGLDFPEETPEGVKASPRGITKGYITVVATVFLVSFLAVYTPQYQDVDLPRKQFSMFPLDIGVYRGEKQKMDLIMQDRLQMDDYMMINYYDSNRNPINLYIAYYSSQNKGASIHSPAACIPGGGWQISDIKEQLVDDITMSGKPLTVNRVEIQKGENKQLVWYWFPQRDRIVTNEYLLKWYLFVDGVMRGRTDGALVRLTTSVGSNEEWSESERRLEKFARMVVPQLKEYLPQ